MNANDVAKYVSKADRKSLLNRKKEPVQCKDKCDQGTELKCSTGNVWMQRQALVRRFVESLIICNIRFDSTVNVKTTLLRATTSYCSTAWIPWTLSCWSVSWMLCWLKVSRKVWTAFSALVMPTWLRRLSNTTK